MRKWMLLAGGLFIGLAVAEGVCRLVIPNPITGPPDPNRTTWRVEGLVADPLVDYSFQPGFAGRMTLPGNYDLPFRTNAQGLRLDHDVLPEHPGVTRILLVGDSFVFGIGVELPDSLGTILESTLDADGTKGQAVEVIPVGVPGYALDDYTKLVEHWVPLLHPDLVLVAFYPGNDLIDYELKARDRNVVIEGYLVKERQAWSWNLRKYSVLAHMLLRRFNPHSRIDEYRKPDPTPADILHMYKTTEPWIERLATVSADGGPPVALWILDSKYMVQMIRAGNLDVSVPPMAGITAALRERGCRVFHSVDAWATAEGPTDDFFFPTDAHFSAKGTHLMAKALAPQLRSNYGKLLRTGSAKAAGAAPDAR